MRLDPRAPSAPRRPRRRSPCPRRASPQRASAGSCAPPPRVRLFRSPASPRPPPPARCGSPSRRGQDRPDGSPVRRPCGKGAHPCPSSRRASRSIAWSCGSRLRHCAPEAAARPSRSLGLRQRTGSSAESSSSTNTVEKLALRRRLWLCIQFSQRILGSHTMMGERRVMQEALFYGFSPERRVPDDHLSRKIDRFVASSEVRAHLGP